jgi:hypothetical protein
MLDTSIGRRYASWGKEKKIRNLNYHVSLRNSLFELIYQ